MDFVKGGSPEHLVIVRKSPGIMAVPANRRCPTLMPGTARIAATHVIDNPAIAINKRAVQVFVAQGRSVDPRVQRFLGDPKAVGSEAAVWNCIPESNQTFADGRVIGKQRAHGR